jgi:hypothetical protein
MERRMIAIYAPRPLDTVLWGPSAVEIFDYVPGSGIAAQLSRTLLLAGIELDAWLRTITASIDAQLTESALAAIDVVDRSEGTNRRTAILAQTSRLANALAALMIPARHEPNTTVAPPAVREAFRELLHDRLSNFYATQAVLAAGDAPPELLRGPDVVRDAHGAVVASVKHVVEGGAAVDVPLARRAYPEQVEILNQAGEAEPADATVRELPLWRYLFAYARLFHDPRDNVRGRIAFDTSGDAPRDFATASSGGCEDALSGMAEFVVVFPAVADDLLRLLGEVGRDTEPDPEAVRNAGIALDALTDLISRISIPADKRIRETLQEDAGTETPAAPAETLAVGWSIWETADANGALVVSIELDENAGLPIDAFTVFVGDPTVNDARPLRQEAQTAAGGPLLRRFVYAIDGDPKQLLSAADGQKTLERAIMIGGLDLFRWRSARTSARVVRNGSLPEPFVYCTPDVATEESVLPKRDVDAAFPIGNAPASLQEHLARFFGDLFANAGAAPGIAIGADVSYTYDVSGIPARIPIYKAAPAPVDATSPAELIAVWSDAIFAWFRALTPHGDGTLHFDLSVVGDDAAPRVLLRLRDATLPLALIDPLPSTAAN